MTLIKSLFAVLLLVLVHTSQAGALPTSSAGNAVKFQPTNIGPQGSNAAVLAGMVSTYSANPNGAVLASMVADYGVSKNGQALADAVNAFDSAASGKIRVRVAAEIPKAAVASAIGRFAGKAIPFVGTGVALYELAQELGMTVSRGPDGKPQFSKVVQDSGDYWTLPPHAGVPGEFSSPQAACDASGYPWSTRWFPDGACQYMYGPVKHTRDSAIVKPATRQEFEDAVAAKSGWPSSSSLGDALKDAINSGETVKAEPKTITGPATSPGTKTVTTSNEPTAANPNPSPADAKTTTTTTTNNYQYDGDTITNTTTTVTTTYDPATGLTKTDTKNEDPEVKPDDNKTDPEPVATDTPLPEVPDLYTPKYPRGIQGVWDDQKASLANTPLARLAPSLMPSVSGGGQCPEMMIDLTFATWASFGTRNVAPPCEVWDWGKAIIILSALLLARALVFGG